MKATAALAILGLLSLFLAVAGTTTYARDAALIWPSWKTRFQKTYSPAEELQRLQIFKNNLAEADRRNAIEGSAVFGPSKFADLTPEEFKPYLGFRPSSSNRHASAKIEAPFQAQDIPDAYNWADENATTPVYNQGQCGSCWAFSTTEQIESMWYLKHKSGSSNVQIQQLSMQQIVDCDKKDGDEGCNGGDTVTAYAYVQRVGGLDSYGSFPYTGEDGKCTFETSDIKADISGWSYVTDNVTKNETQMLYYVGTTGPISICVDAASWQLYFGGIIKYVCGQNLDHCVQLTGYGTEKVIETTDYWVIRNSWGADWGESGFLKVERNKNLCGVADEATTVAAV